MGVDRLRRECVNNNTRKKTSELIRPGTAHAASGRWGRGGLEWDAEVGLGWVGEGGFKWISSKC